MQTTSSLTAKDAEIPLGPSDSISCLSFSPQSNHLSVGSWDNKIRLYNINPSLPGQSTGEVVCTLQAPILDICWKQDGNKLFSGGADNTARMLDMFTGQSEQVAQHSEPVKAVRWVESPNGSYLVTGSWDKTIKYWDLRSATPMATVQLPERCYSMDAAYPLLAVGTAGRHLLSYDLRQPTVPYQTVLSPISWQTRAISCFPDGTGFAVGTTGGRTAIRYVEQARQSSNYTFRCQRHDSTPAKKDGAIIYAVNNISFHPLYGTFSTSGSDGTITFWDGEGRARLGALERSPGPISATCFNRNGTLFAYAVSYDWHKGHSGMVPDHPNKLMIHISKDDETKPKPKTSTK